MNTLSLATPKILVYQNDDCQVLTDFLRFYGYDPVESSAEDVVENISHHTFDLCILDHCFSSIPGDTKIIKEVRNVNEQIPIVVVSEYGKYEYMLDAFDCGADDYLTRPYNMEELIRRIRALLKRCGLQTKAVQTRYKFSKYLLKADENSLLDLDTKIGLALTAKESRILALLCSCQNEVLPKEIILKDVWHEDNYYNRRSLDVHVCRLRSYFKEDDSVSIKTKRGIGYSLVVR